jgi:hypothetical protein
VTAAPFDQFREDQLSVALINAAIRIGTNRPKQPMHHISGALADDWQRPYRRGEE